MRAGPKCPHLERAGIAHLEVEVVELFFHRGCFLFWQVYTPRLHHHHREHTDAASSARVARAYRSASLAPLLCKLTSRDRVQAPRLGSRRPVGPSPSRLQRKKRPRLRYAQPTVSVDVLENAHDFGVRGS